MSERVVGLFFKSDSENGARIASLIKSADYDASVNFTFWAPDDGYPDAGRDFGDMEFAVSIGGDGTFLRVARAVRGLGIPLYGINAGRLGFLASGRPENAALDVVRILSGDFTKSSRAALKCELLSNGARRCFYALNEITLSKVSTSRPIGLRVMAGGEVLYRFLADGVIISTPTGSTAYSLSAGGPVVHPDVSCLLVTPICPHSLYSRPIVLGENEIIDVYPDYESEGMKLAGDGILDIEVPSGDVVRVTLDKKGVDIIKLDYLSYYEVLRKKLNWCMENIQNEHSVVKRDD
ncbi:MAG: NAD(+)/NADH kinase [Synergistaceae bacterium]|jgi:NAD+ kinase|nr:NAD(+)/NADH kinase [Synergistaceae bacterium]